MSNPDAEGAVNSINEFTQYVKDHGTIAEGMRADINKNKEDIAAEAARAAGVEGGLDTRLTAVEGPVATKAAQADHEALAGRVTTVEGKVTTLEGEMDDAQEAIAALEELVGDENVADQISGAIDGALKVDGVEKYALATALTEAVGQHNTDKAALEAEIAKKANDADLAAIAKTGSTDDLVMGELVLVFDCGTSAV
jgi:chromosome segregation ATPase